MHTGSSEASRAVITFLGFESASAPQQDHRRLVEEFGAGRARELKEYVVSLLDELAGVEVDWTKHTLQSAGEMARGEMHARHPELSEQALRALEWKFTYDWR